MFFHLFKRSPQIKREKVSVSRDDIMHSARKMTTKGYKVCVYQTPVNVPEKVAYREGIEIYYA